MTTEHGSNSPASPTISSLDDLIESDREFRSQSPKTATRITKHELLDRAKEAVADRGLNYGTPEDNFIRIARLWAAHMYNRYNDPIAIDAIDVALMMDLMKTARLENEPRHLDSWVDKAGYAACGANIAADDPTR